MDTDTIPVVADDPTADHQRSACCHRGRRSIRLPIRRNHRHRGTVLVEFALLLPWLILIVLACIDFGRFAYLYIAVTNAARAGAEFAVMRPGSPASQPAWQAGVLAAVQDEMANNQGYSSTDLAVSTSLTPGSAEFEAGGSHRATSFPHCGELARHPIRNNFGESSKMLRDSVKCDVQQSK